MPFCCAKNIDEFVGCNFSTKLLFERKQKMQQVKQKLQAKYTSILESSSNKFK